MSAQGNPVTRRSHTVNKSYLKRFADTDGLLTQVILPGTIRVPVSITDATVHKNFYIVTLPDGTESDAAEDFFCNIEGAATTSIRALVDRRAWPIQGLVRARIARWIAAQYLRVPSVRALSAEIDRALKGDGQPIVTKTGEVVPRPEPRGRPDLARIQLQLIGRNLDVIAEMLYDRPWTLTFFQRKTLATCDTPVSLVGPIGRYGIPGIMDAVEIHVPLDRRVSLSIMEKGGSDGRIQGTAKAAKWLNEKTVSNARRFLFHHPGDDPLAGLELPEPRDREIRNTEAAGELIRDALVEVLRMPELRDHPANPLVGLKEHKPS